MSMDRRAAREIKTVRAMIEIFCAERHGRKTLCLDCAGLLRYAEKRLALCRWGVNKPACSECTIHCYKPEMRGKIREVMRYSGPRMTLRHPVLAALHFADKKRGAGQKRKLRR